MLSVQIALLAYIVVRLALRTLKLEERHRGTKSARKRKQEGEKDDIILLYLEVYKLDLV